MQSGPGSRFPGVLDPHGPVARAERLIMGDATAIMLAVIVPVIICTLLFAWWFRSSNTKATYRPDWEYSGRLELLVWSIPAMVVLFLGGICVLGTYDLDPYRRSGTGGPIDSTAKPLEVQVVSLDWKWLFIYPDQGVASVNRLVIPAGVPIHFRLTSATVMNSFFIPELGSQIYTMAGMATQLSLLADRAGIYPGLSAQFSGDGFSNMNFDAQAMQQADFDNWVAEARGAEQALDEAAYSRLTQESQAVPPTTYRAVAPGLFDRVVTMQAPPADSAPSGQGGALSPLPKG